MHEEIFYYIDCKNPCVRILTGLLDSCLLNKRNTSLHCSASCQSYGNIAFNAQFKYVPCIYFSDSYNYDGKNGEGGLSKSPSASGSVQESYYQGDGYYIPTSAAKAPKKKTLFHKGGKALFQGPLVTISASAGSYLSSSGLGQPSNNQHCQVQGKRSFNHSQGGTSAYTCSTAYPSQVTGGAGGSQEYSYEGEFCF